MTTQDFIIALFYAVDQEMLDVPKHPEAKLSPREVVTLALLHAIKGGGTRAFYRWLTRDSLAVVSPRARAHPLGPALQDAHRVDRPLSGGTHRAGGGGHLWDRVDPPHAGRTQPGPDWQKGQSNHRWIVGGKLCFILNQWGLICAWDCATANVHDTHFQPLIAQFDGQMIVLTDTGFHAKTGDPAQHESLSAWHLEHPDGGGNGVVDAHDGVS